MIETTKQYTLGDTDVFEALVEKESFRLNHAIIEPGKFFPKHPTDANVIIIVIRGELSITLGDQEPAIYKKGQVIQAPKGVESILGNGSETYTEVFVIKD